ncbi:Aldo/keto reductase family protein [compost metagenome]
MQLEYSLVQRSIEREHLPLAQAYDIGVTAWSPMAGGILTGKYTRAAVPDGTGRIASMQLQAFDERNQAIARAVDKVADGLGVPSSHVALAWVLSRGVLPIVGATRPEQICENLAACSLKLDAQTLAELDQVSAFDSGHPYNMLDWDMPMSLGYGGMFEQIDIPRFPGRRQA